MKRVAVTGATGFIGGNVCEALRLEGYEVLALTRTVPTNIVWPYRVVDFGSAEDVAQALAGVDAVVHCAIANDFNRLTNSRELAYESFVGLTSRITRAANQANCQMVYISTDWVMDGMGHLELETNPGNPINFYGYLKALGEQVVRDLAEDGAICRIAGVMGRHQSLPSTARKQDVGFGYFVYSLIESLQAGADFTVWTGPNVNQVTSPSLAAEVGAQIGRVIGKGSSGTFHLVGDDAIARMELAQLTCEIFDLPKRLLKEGFPPSSELFSGPVPADSSLSNLATKQALGLGSTSLEDLLLAFKTELETGQLTYISKS